MPQMHLIAWLATGPIAYHTGGWHYPTAENAYDDPARLASWAQTLERAKFDAVFFADGADFDAEYAARNHVQFLDLVPTAAVIAHETSRIGIGITVNSTVNDPFNIARSIGTLDYASGGRMAWNVVTGSSESEAAKYGRTLLPRAERYARADESIEVCKRLWASFPADALTTDRTRDSVVDVSQLDHFTYEGEYVSAVGPLPTPASPQGGPVILQAGASPAGRALAAKHADVVFIMSRTAEKIRESVEAIKADAVEAGRAGEVLVIPAATIVVAETTEIARARWAELNSYVDVEQAIDSASSLTGLDLRSLPLDLPVRELPESEQGSVGLTRLLREAAGADDATLAEAAAAMVNSAIPLLIGNPVEVADQLQALHETTGADGFMLHAPIVPSGFEDFARAVVPILQERGLFRTEYESSTLRGNLCSGANATADALASA